MEKTDCPCKRTKCVRYRNCSECRAHHHELRGGKSLPYCEKLALKADKRAKRRAKHEKNRDKGSA